MSELNNKISSAAAGFSRNELLLLVAIVIVVFGFLGRPVPFNNENVYLLRLLDGFLPNDWSFSVRANEHWLFNYIFSFPAAILPLEIVGWGGRLLSWFACGAGFILLARLWNLPLALLFVAFVLWLLIGQSVVNGEWIFGTFEAKTIAYALLLPGLWATARGRLKAGALLLGLTFSFHPAVGIWSAIASSVAVLFIEKRIREIAWFYALMAISMLPGFIPLAKDQLSGAEADNEIWKFLVTKAMPYHLDPFVYSRSELVGLGVMFVFAATYLFLQRTATQTFLAVFLIALFGFFLSAFLLRIFDQYALLRFMPMRLFPLFTPLFFLFSLFGIFRAHRLRLAAVPLILIAFVGYFPAYRSGPGFSQLIDNINAWRAKDDELTIAYDWIAKNMSRDAIIASSPTHKEVWYRTRHATIAAFRYPIYAQLPEWMRRITALTGNRPLNNAENILEEIDSAFFALTVSQVNSLRREFGSQYILTQSEYPFRLVYSNSQWKLYEIPGDFVEIGRPQSPKTEKTYSKSTLIDPIGGNSRALATAVFGLNNCKNSHAEKPGRAEA